MPIISGMSDPVRPTFGQVNLVVKDLPAAVAFYRRLGLAMEEAAHPEWARHHASAALPNGVRFELDSVDFARQWNPGLKASPGCTGGVLFFAVPGREDVDRLFDAMTSSGCAAQKAPEDAFWGSRYAIVEDPDGNPVGIMSPVEPDRRRAPPAPPRNPL
jgi:catechol 2,3-dioxygenase-like lactoylglutathione lyase family enzyme